MEAASKTLLRLGDEQHSLILKQVVLFVVRDALGEGYEQWGTLWGTVSVGGSVTNIHAPSLRRHCWKLPNVRARLDMVGIADNGTLFSVGYNFANVR